MQFENPMQSYKSHLALLQATGTSPRLANLKTPQLLLDFFADQVETQTAILGGHARKADLQELLRRVMRKAKPCFSSVVLALFYLDRLWKNMAAQQQHGLSSKKTQLGLTGLPEVIAAFILADKYVYDIALANCEWAKVSGTHTLAQVNSYEREFFGLLNFNIQFSEQSYLEFVSFLEVSLTIRHHRLQATADFPLTYADLCQAASIEVTSAAASTESLVSSSSATSSLSLTSSRPSDASLVSLRSMMLCCVTYCAIMFTVSAAVHGVKTTLERQQLHHQTIVLSTSTTPSTKTMKNAISRSESWNGCSASASASALPRPSGRKFSDAMMEDSNPWALSAAASGRIRS